jgi:hypothetical protein
MPVLRRTAYFAVVAAVLGSGLAACSSGQAGGGAVRTTPDGVNHLLHLPGVSENTQVLAPSAVAALQDWAQPYAQPA